MKSFALAFAAMAALAAAPAAAFGVNSTSGSLTLANTAGNTGACTAGSCILSDISFSAPGTIFTPTWAVYDTVTVQVTGTWSGTITFQGSQDEGATWVNVPVSPWPSSTKPTSVPLGVTSTTANGNWTFDGGGATTFRAVMTSFSSGSAVIVLEKQQAEQYVAINALPPSQNSQNISYAFDSSETVPTSAQDLAAIEADGTNRLYLRHVKVCPGAGFVQTTAGYRNIVLFPTTAASAGGSTQTPNPIDSADGAFGGVARTGALTTTPAVGSVTNATALDSWTLWVPATVAAETAQVCAESFYGDAQGQKKPPTVAKTTSKGLALADLTGGAGGAGVYIITMDFTTEPL